LKTGFTAETRRNTGVSFCSLRLRAFAVKNLMRILHLDSGAEMRGGQWQVLRLIEGLGAAGHESTLLARGGSPLYVEARNRGIDVSAWSYLSVARRSGEADIVHAHDARSHTAAAWVAAHRLVVSRRVAFLVLRISLLCRST
jgi:hypothetical protein